MGQAKNVKPHLFPHGSFNYLPVPVSLSLCQATGPPTTALHPSPHPSSTSASLQSFICVSLEGVGQSLSGASSRTVRKLQWWGVHPAICKKTILTVYLLMSDLPETLVAVLLRHVVT